MTIEAELPDGTILEFPDGTADNIIQGAVKSELGVASQPEAPQEQPQPTPQRSTGGGRTGHANRLRQERESNLNTIRAQAEKSGIPLARDLPEIGDAPELNELSMKSFLASAGALFTFEDEEVGEILKKQTGATISKDVEGSLVATFPSGGTFAINKPGFSAQDLAKGIAAALAFTPGARVATGVGGALAKRAGTQALAAGLTEAGIQAGQTAIGGDFDLSDVALAGTFAGGAEFIAPLFRATRDGIRSLKGTGDAAPPVTKEAAIEQFRSVYSQQETLQQRLRNLGVNPKQLEETAIKALSEAPENANPEEVIASALFKELDIPTLKSRITQEGAQFQAEQELRARPDVLGQQVRERVAEEAVGFQQALRNIIDDTGLPEEAGETIKGALSERKGLVRIGVKKAYDRLKKLPGNGLPVLSGSMKHNFIRSDRIKRLARTDAPSHKALQDTLTEFGVLTDDSFIDAFNDPSSIKSLTVDNVEDFRQALNELVDPTNPAKTGAVKQIINRLDAELKTLDEALKAGDLGEAGLKAKEKIQAARIARTVSRKQKKEFNPIGIIGKLTNPKKGNFDLPFIEADNVVRQLVSRSKTKPTFADLDRVMGSLEKAGPKGNQAIGNLQAATIMSLLEESTKGLASKPAAGVVGFSGANFRKSLEGIGQKELNRLFKDSPQILNTLNKLSVAAELTQPISDVMNSSQSGVIIKNFISDKLRMVPGLAEAAKGAGDVAQKKQAQKAARSALQANFNSTRKAALSRYPKITDIIFDSGGSVPGTQQAAQILRTKQE